MPEHFSLSPLQVSLAVAIWSPLCSQTLWAVSTMGQLLAGGRSPWTLVTTSSLCCFDPWEDGSLLLWNMFLYFHFVLKV